MTDTSQMDEEAQKEKRRGYLLAGFVAVFGLFVVILSLVTCMCCRCFGTRTLFLVGLISAFLGFSLVLTEHRSHKRWRTWYKKARPYRESKHLMYPYNPYPNVICWNCGQLVRKPAQPHTFDRYVKPTWKKFDGRWKAFCSNCGANVTKDVTEAKYGKPYTGKIWPKFYKQSLLDTTRPCPNCGKLNMKNAKTCIACGTSTEIKAD